MSASRSQLADARRKLSAAEARLEVAERELRVGGGAARETSLAYLRSVIIKYIEEEEDGTASADSLFQVLATFLRIDPPTVVRLQAARSRKATSQQGLWGTLRAAATPGR